ncbi:MAG: hypothetical protein CMJ76_14815 [Planctomycetaceae bacterium]|nr:hypothetical protein [Planctomycetaceae bacterium]
MLRHTEIGQSWLRGQWIEDLSQATNSNIEIDHIHFLQPGKYALENVRISDRESNRLICQANHVDVDYSSSSTNLTIHTLQIPDVTPVTWMNWWNEHILAISQEYQINIKVGLTLLNDLPIDTLNNSTAEMELSEDSSKLTVNWGDQQQPFALQLTRTHAYPIVSTFLLQTNGNQLELSAINGALPLQIELGDKATFNGQFISKYHPGQFTSEVDFAADGEIRNVELNRILQQSDKAMIDGLATVKIHRAICNRNQWKRLQGTIVGGQGTIARSWLPQLASKLQLRWLGDLREETVPYESLHCEFTWDPSGFTLRGESDGAYIGTILRHKNGPILGDKPDSVIRSATLNEALNR